MLKKSKGQKYLWKLYGVLDTGKSEKSFEIKIQISQRTQNIILLNLLCRVYISFVTTNLWVKKPLAQSLVKSFCHRTLTPIFYNNFIVDKMWHWFNSIIIDAYRSWEVAWSTARRCGQVPDTTEVSPAPHHLGRGGDLLLLQGEVQTGPHII